MADFSNDGIESNFPILMQYCDGGPDHRVTYISVKIAALVLFIAFNLDMFVIARTAPMQSYSNPAERCMSLLNLGLQHCAFARNKMPQAAEEKMHSVSSITQLRQKSNLHPSLKKDFMASLDGVKETINNRFHQLTLKDRNVVTHTAADEDTIDSLMINTLHIIDPELGWPITAKDVEKHPNLKEFMANHTMARQYTFQVKYSHHRFFVNTCR
jgi:hypothetical protein